MFRGVEMQDHLAWKESYDQPRQHIKNAFESVLMRWMILEPIIQREVSQKEKHQYSILTHIYMEFRKMAMSVCKTAKKTQMCIADFWTQWKRERVG